MSDERRLAVLIDSDNVSAKYAQFIMQEVVKYGTPTYKRVYGDWEKGGNGWHSPAVNYSIMPVQQTCYVAGKNATDFSMIIDAMDILYTGKVDGFVLVTSDSDFTRLAIRLRESGMLVVGIGEVKTPRAFTASCSHFCYLNQVCENEGMADEPTIRKAVLDFVAENRNERLDLAKIFAVLTSRFGNINFDEMGYKRFSSFIDSFRELRRNNTFVTMRKKREEAAPAPVIRTGEPTERDITDTIAEYFEKNPPERDNMMKIESYLMAVYGKIDFSRFGSKRFARFIDKLDGYTRNGTDIAPVGYKAQGESAPQPALPVVAAKTPPAVIREAPAAKNAAAERAVPAGHAVPAEHAAPAEPAAAAPDDTPKEKPTLSAAEGLVLKYAAENMPDGGNLGQLNNELMARFGKGYLAALGAEDIKSLLAQMKDIRVRRNHVFLTDAKYAEWDFSAPAKPEAEEKPAKPAQVSQPVQPVSPVSPEKSAKPEQPKASEAESAVPEKNASVEQNAAAAEAVVKEPAQQGGQNEGENAAEPAQKNRGRHRRGEKHARHEQRVPQDTEQSAPAQEAAADEQPAKPQQAAGEPSEPTAQPEQPAEKAEINAVKREILHYAASEERPTLSGLGTLMSERYGKGWLKELGFGSVKKLLGEVKGVSVKGSVLSIDEEFAQRTEEIERFVNEFARGEGSRSVRALSSKLKSRFEGFDFTDYGFAKFTDFVNAIDGVKADRYHIKPTDAE